MLPSFAKNNRLSLAILLLLIGYVILWPILNTPPNPFTWDAFGYYLYLPMSIVHQDLGMSDLSIIEQVQQEQFISSTFYQLNQTDTGNTVTKYPAGLAILLSPFYLIGHLVAKLGGYNTNGFSLPYQLAILSGCIFYISTSLVLLRNLLLHWFTDKVVALTLILLFFGTNYINQATFSIAMPHALLFFVYTLIITLTIQWHKTKSIKNSLLLGGVLGLAVICRPTEIVAVLIPIFWEVNTFKAFINKYKVIFTSNKMFLAAVLFAFCTVVFIQLAYWKIYTGKFIYLSYNNPGEGLDLLTPYTWEVLFSFRKGWLIYTPIMIFALTGFYFLRKHKPQFFFAFLSYFVFNLYLVSSWTTWWYAASFSQRALVQSYIVMAILLAFTIQAILASNKVVRYTLSSLLIITFSLTLFQTWQANNGIIHGERMTYEAYIDGFWKTDRNTVDSDLLLIDPDIDFNLAQSKFNYQSNNIYQDNFERGGKNLSTAQSKSGYNSILIDSNNTFYLDYKSPYEELTSTDYIWIETTFWAFITDKNTSISLVNAMLRDGKNYKYSVYDFIQKDSIELNTWKKYTYAYLTPNIRSVEDKFQSYFWYRGGKEAYIDDVKMTVYKPI